MKIILVILSGVLLLFAGCAADVPKNKILNSTQLMENTFWVYYYGANTSISAPLNGLSKIVSNPRFNRTKSTVLYIPGWEENSRQSNVAIIPQSYAVRDGWNVILLNWDRISAGNYLIVWYNSVQLCKILGSILLNAANIGLLTIDHIVGHSLGAHCGSAIGQTMIKGNKKLKRITGLDPAGPLYDPNLIPKFIGASHLTYLDAQFVDVIHTDDYIYGSASQTATADFYPNGGFRWQPGCPRTIPFNLFDPKDFCSHLKSCFLYAQSVSLSYGAAPFYAVSANSWRDFKNRNISIFNVEKMGIDCSRRARGKYYLRTENSPKMSLGIAGIF